MLWHDPEPPDGVVILLAAFLAFCLLWFWLV
jgi:hypothetical protein